MVAIKDKGGVDISRELVNNSRKVFEDKTNPRRKSDDDKTAIVIDFPQKETQAILKDLMAE